MLPKFTLEVTEHGHIFFKVHHNRQPKFVADIDFLEETPYDRHFKLVNVIMEDPSKRNDSPKVKRILAEAIEYYYNRFMTIGFR